MALHCLNETFKFGNMHLYFEDSKIDSDVCKVYPPCNVKRIFKTRQMKGLQSRKVLAFVWYRITTMYLQLC